MSATFLEISEICVTKNFEICVKKMANDVDNSEFFRIFTAE